MHCCTIKFPKNGTFMVTGGAGFIGSNLTEALLSMGQGSCAGQSVDGICEEYRGISRESGFRVYRGGYPRCGALHACVRGSGLCAASGGGECT